MTTRQSTHSKNHHVPHAVVARAAKAATSVSVPAAKTVKRVRKVVTRAEKSSKNYGWMAAGAIVGVGALLGALSSVMRRRSTLDELLDVNALPSKAKRAISRYF